jgi:purine-nucleoside phosphorylase
MTETLAFQQFAVAAQASPPIAALVFGSGMSDLGQRVQQVASISFNDLPALPATTIPGHRGLVKLGDWSGKRVLVFEGRLHYYEGHPWQTVILPVQIARSLGARVLLLTNAAGGIRDDLAPGCLLSVRDHIEWTAARAWLQPGPGALGPPRPAPYSPRLLGLMEQAGKHLDKHTTAGVYAAVTGPSYETPAEIRALKRWGADAVGMSTTREIQAGFDAGMECAAVSCITNRAAGLGAGPLDHQEVLATAVKLQSQLGDLLEAFLRLL